MFGFSSTREHSDDLAYHRKLRVAGTGAYLPQRRMSNEEAAALSGSDTAWVQSVLGIRERRIAAQEEMTSDMARAAAERAIESAGWHPREIDLVIVATATADRQAPSTACILQERLGIGGVPAFDVSAVCSGFLYALSTAEKYLLTGSAAKALVIGADSFSRITDWKDRDAVFFGDGAGAVVLERCDREPGRFATRITASGKGVDNFTVKPGRKAFEMDSSGVRDAALELLPDLIANLLNEAGLRPSDIDHFIPHQPSIRLLREITRASAINENKLWTNMDRYANTAGATVPILLDEAVRSGEIKKGENLLLAAVGAGMTAGAAVITW